MHFFFAFRGYLHSYITIIVPNVLIFIIVYYKIMGLKKFLNEEISFKNKFQFFIMLSAIYAICFTVFYDSALIRNILLSLYGMGFSLYFTYKFLTSEFKRYAFIKNIGAAASLVYFFIVLGRIVSWFGDSTINHLLSSSLFNSMYFLMVSIINIIWAGLFLMISSIRQTNELEFQKNKEIKLLKELATKDPLTKLFNRNESEKFLSRQIELKKSKNIPVTLAIMDIDNFKSINDSFGHNVGDKVLIEFSNLLRHHSDENTFNARWGGEEFLIVYSNTLLESAIEKAEKLRKAIYAHGFSTNKKESASFGLAEFQIDESTNNWIFRADNCLYKAKELDKNRVEY
jgi:diguanylate cyclase (GGDEF)-like protein